MKMMAKQMPVVTRTNVTPLNLSIIVPLYNEEENVKPLYDAIVAQPALTNTNHEVLFVDDGSSDETFERAKRLATTDGKLRILKLRRNFGQTPAMAAGIDHAQGDILITMDGDLQNDPADIEQFLVAINKGYDVVVGWLDRRLDNPITRTLPSRIANWLIGKVTRVPIKDNGCSLKAFRADIIKNVPLYSEMHRFIPAMTSLTGARLMEIKVRHHARKYGVSKYGLNRIYKVLLDLLVIKTIVSFAARPLHWFSLLALPTAVVSFTTLVSSLYQVFGHSSTFSIPIAGTGVLFGALTVILLLAGMLGELVYKTGGTRLDKLSLLTAEKLQSKVKDQ
jgi:glycosyltransferase involved in cell wall biosynthesis